MDNNILGTFNIFRAAKAPAAARWCSPAARRRWKAIRSTIKSARMTHQSRKSLYGASKPSAKSIAAYFAHQEGLSALSVRIANFTTLSRGEQQRRDMSAFSAIATPPICWSAAFVSKGCNMRWCTGFPTTATNVYRWKRPDACSATPPQDDAFSLLGFGEHGGEFRRAGTNSCWRRPLFGLTVGEQHQQQRANPAIIAPITGTKLYPSPAETTATGGGPAHCPG